MEILNNLQNDACVKNLKFSGLTLIIWAIIFYALDNKTKCYPHMKQLLKYRMRDDEKRLLKFPKIRRNFTEHGMEF